jgi:hypothetical protein
MENKKKDGESITGINVVVFFEVPQKANFQCSSK